MGRKAEAECRDMLRRAVLPGQGALTHLLALLLDAPETHISLGDVVRMAAEARFAATPDELCRQLETLADHGLLSRVPSTASEPIYDTEPKPHSHLVYEETGQIVDLDVTSETLLAVIRRTLSERPEGVEVWVRVRGVSGVAASPAARAEARIGGVAPGPLRGWPWQARP